MGRGDGLEVAHCDWSYLRRALSPSWPDGHRVALADEAETIQVFQTPSLTPRFALAGHLDTINALCYSDDGARLASGSNDGARASSGRR